MTRSLRVAVCLLSILGSVAKLAAEQKPGVPRPQAYGTTNWTIDRIAATEFTPTISGLGYASFGSAVYSTSPGGIFHAATHVPKGALLTYFVLDYCDNVTGATVEAWLYSSPHDDPATTTNLSHLISTTQTPCTSAYEDLTALKHTVNQNVEDLYVEVETHGGFLDSSFTGVSLFSQLQVSPAPATATFADVPTDYPYFRFIEALASAGITKGCGAGIFCPGQAITRGEVATWLARALGLDWAP